MGPICVNGVLHAAADAGSAASSATASPAGSCWSTGGGRDRPAGRAARPGARRRRGRRRRPDPAAAGRRRARSGSTPSTTRRTPAAGAQDAVAARAGRPRRRRGLPVPRAGVGAGDRAALRSGRRATVVDLAFYTGGADDVALGEEFHHNGLSLRCAQIGRVPRGPRAPLGPRAGSRGRRSPCSPTPATDVRSTWSPTSSPSTRHRHCSPSSATGAAMPFQRFSRWRRPELAAAAAEPTVTPGCPHRTPPSSSRFARMKLSGTDPTLNR